MTISGVPIGNVWFVLHYFDVKTEQMVKNS